MYLDKVPVSFSSYLSPLMPWSCLIHVTGPVLRDSVEGEVARKANWLCVPETRGAGAQCGEQRQGDKVQGLVQLWSLLYLPYT